MRIDINGTVRDMTAEEEAEFYARKEQISIPQEQLYEEAIVDKIRTRYSLNAELALLRQRDIKPQEFADYNAYVEQCKARAHLEVYGATAYADEINELEKNA